jgi:hypothetical protein
MKTCSTRSLKYLVLLAVLIVFLPANTGDVQSAEVSSVILPSWYAQSDQGGSEFGFAVAGAGDVNGDGYDDILIGAPKYDDGSVRGGAAFVFHGGPAGFGDAPHWSFGGEVKGSRLGAAVAGAGDINSDGYDDIMASPKKAALTSFWVLPVGWNPPRPGPTNPILITHSLAMQFQVPGT